MEIIAIGDVHGRADLLEKQLDFAARKIESYRVLFLGDIIDRGPDSHEAMALVAQELRREASSVLIQGNHEDLMLRFIDRGREFSMNWRYNGGDACVDSYVPMGSAIWGEPDDQGPGWFRDELRSVFTDGFPEHVELLRSAKPYVETERYFFTHAGIDPALPLDKQDPYKLRWDGKTLAAYYGPLPKIIVHGHMITDGFLPEVHSNRINVDTGAYASDRLTALRIRPCGTASFLMSEGRPGRLSYSVTESQPLAAFGSMPEEA
ncbi:metallophosphoesterase [Pararhizobium qamdonense]|uniref:metallophosphoesterase n=1 Tax=Pararhizobium qamdonense TaxID=3031126 RepID=UPI0023E1D3C4|nr:metallophosphoesterase [Pararhizobium qamdonense]